MPQQPAFVTTVPRWSIGGGTACTYRSAWQVATRSQRCHRHRGRWVWAMRCEARGTGGGSWDRVRSAGGERSALTWSWYPSRGNGIQQSRWPSARTVKGWTVNEIPSTPQVPSGQRALPPEVICLYFLGGTTGRPRRQRQRRAGHRLHRLRHRLRLHEQLVASVSARSAAWSLESAPCATAAWTSVISTTGSARIACVAQPAARSLTPCYRGIQMA
jgi:hypothetical protein